MKIFAKIIGSAVAFIVLLFILFLAYLNWGLQPDVPKLKDKTALDLVRKNYPDSLYKINKNWLKRNDTGWWEEYVEGEPFERGVILGKLNKDMLYSHELAFINQIKSLVPSESYLKFLKFFIRFFNRNLEANFPLEYKEEIYGESFSAPHEFDFIAPAYDRMLNYHAAHDIGHALQNLALVGCTSFAAWDEFSVDSGLIIGRNFDFYVGDEFAESKILLFVKPTEGYKMAMLTWPGMIGCVSGMNDQGLTVTLNAAKSDIPTAAATPISILAREILQYAKNIDEAYAIAKKRKTFVSETLMIGSANDHKTALIEKSPNKTALFFSDKNKILCSNHYQSNEFLTEENNIKNKAESASLYRFERLKELIDTAQKLSPQNVIDILRDQKGKGGKDIGIGNEKALNQLIGLHSIVFQPEKRRFWISTTPFQLGQFVCYDFDSVFAKAATLNKNEIIYTASEMIAADPFVLSIDWTNFLTYKKWREEIKVALKKDPKTNNMDAKKIIEFNPNYWEAYFWAGSYYLHQGQKSEAERYFKQALTKEINDLSEVRKLNILINECKATQP